MKSKHSRATGVLNQRPSVPQSTAPLIEPLRRTRQMMENVDMYSTWLRLRRECQSTRGECATCAGLSDQRAVANIQRVSRTFKKKTKSLILGHLTYH